MKKFFCCVLTFFILATPSNALSIVYGDYDNDQWDIEQISFSLPEDIPDGWYPLKTATDYFNQVYVSWNEKTREIMVCSNDLSWLYLESFKSDELPDFLVIKNGSTYCSPEYLASLVSNRGFYYEGELYYFAGEAARSELVRSDDETFRKKVLTILFQMKLAFPDVYKLVRESLSGGIEQIHRSELPYKFSYDVDRNSVAGYTTVGISVPTCYVVSCFYNTKKSNLAEVISHEAYHIHSFNSNGYIGEDLPTAYGHHVRDLFVSMEVEIHNED